MRSLLGPRSVLLMCLVLAGAALPRCPPAPDPPSPKGAMDYRGFAEVERQPAVEPVRPLLPNLVTLPSRNPTMRTGAYLYDHEVEGTPCCYPEEMTEKGARRCLRFDQIIANRGDGPFELRYRMEGLATDQQLRQRIFSSDGSFTDVPVDTYEFHPTHAHFHYKSEALLRLFFAEHGTKEGLLATLAGLEAQANEMRAESLALGAEYLSDRAPFPERIHILGLVGKFVLDQTSLVAGWARWAHAEVEGWPAVDTAPASPDAVKAFQALMEPRAGSNESERN